MKCSDCNGIIEGKMPFCPHCGRRSGSGKGIHDFPAQEKLSRPYNSRHRPQTDRPATTVSSGSFSMHNQDGRKQSSSLRELLKPLPASIRNTTLYVIGGIILSMIVFGPSTWLMGAVFGFVISHNIGKMSK